MDDTLRIKIAYTMQDIYADFLDFAPLAMQFLGFKISEIQLEIAQYMAYGPKYRMIMAQRGEAKTTIAAIYAVWVLIQKPSARVLVVSAGAELANNISTLIIRIINKWDMLEYLRPDRAEGDGTSTSSYDIHNILKGVDKSPSVACVGMTSTLPSRRADLLLADDIESNTNSKTPNMQEGLLVGTREFSSICTDGEIVYLGTPQNRNSVYRSLPGRGFSIRIWPGRYPSEELEEQYQGMLAPSLALRMKEDPSLRTGGGIDGTRGKPVDPVMLNEEILCTKELDQGQESFQLQYMLDTSLSDAIRQQLKLSDVIVANFSPDMVPEVLAWQETNTLLKGLSPTFTANPAKMYYPANTSSSWVAPKDVFMYVDPAGQGTDEIGFACGFSVGPYIHIKDVGGVRGGLVQANEELLVEFIKRNAVTRVRVESNAGLGQFERNFIAMLNQNGLEKVANQVLTEYSTGQKEVRIINSMVSALQRHRIVFHEQMFVSDDLYCKKYNQEQRKQYSVWYQMANITTERKSLPHDDRIEAVAGVVREFGAVLVQDENKAAKLRKELEVQAWKKNPMGYTDSTWTSRHKKYKGTREKVYAR